MVRMLLALTLIHSSLVIAACNTVRGAAEDVNSAANAVDMGRELYSYVRNAGQLLDSLSSSRWAVGQRCLAAHPACGMKVVLGRCRKGVLVGANQRHDR